MHAPTGTQYALHLEHDGAVVDAIVTEVAAGLRSLEVNGTALVETFPETSTPPGAAGIVLVPWPNRVAGGRWMLDGAPQQLDVTEVKTGNAIHGLLRFTGYRLVEREASRVLQTATVFPQHGYPFLLETTVEHALTPDGLAVTHTVTNRSAVAAPVAVGAHPYLRVGEVPVDELVLTLDASTRFVTDEAQIPVGEEPVAGTDFDLTQGRRIGDLTIDHGYGGVRVTDGRSVQSLEAPDGRRVELWADTSFAFVQVFTPVAFAAPEGPRRAVAIEPMTAPANALNSGEGLRWLAPGETWRLAWGIRRAA
ncbi:aldose 1-epimerase family protein [Herbiconiux sp. KACC 21604]|uniref:aldose 1-epimerase family protein n=1 Tax=unclassified Herbiconiux TaxID=2618217 RepID=UPI0014926FAB|nr:aldose 1-epimerase family protein [Herbiconiux sp. SALV-R1]QJU52491.1 aldose 1-epimerase family protein [Herbiconiux sp. SALV-R1]WPO87364.1 aldose 1-epimerase family protein [Herbiconiux sp. KACC 21604]